MFGATLTVCRALQLGGVDLCDEHVEGEARRLNRVGQRKSLESVRPVM
jgi:hypothetical protein